MIKIMSGQCDIMKKLFLESNEVKSFLKFGVLWCLQYILTSLKGFDIETACRNYINIYP